MDIGTRPQQSLVDGLFVRQAEARSGQAHQRRTAAGNQTQRQVIAAEALCQLQHALGGSLAGIVRYRVRRFQDLDALAGYRMAITGNHQARQRAGPVLFDAVRHSRRSLAGPALTFSRVSAATGDLVVQGERAGPQHHGVTGGWFGQVWGKTLFGLY